MISKRSWHYRLFRWYKSDPREPMSLCKYWAWIVILVLALPFAGLLLLLLLGACRIADMVEHRQSRYGTACPFGLAKFVDEDQEAYGNPK